MPTISGQQSVIHKDYILDYTSSRINVIMEHEGGSGGLTYCYTYGLDRISAAVTGIESGAGGLSQTYYYPNGTEAIVKLWYHHDRLGTIDFLMDNVQGKVANYIAYDEWDAPASKTVLKMGARWLDLVTQYTVHPYDQVIGIYFAQARMYDAGDRRFMAVDPAKGSIAVPATLVQHVYVLDNPLKYIDPLGYQTISSFILYSRV